MKKILLILPLLFWLGCGGSEKTDWKKQYQTLSSDENKAQNTELKGHMGSDYDRKSDETYKEWRSRRQEAFVEMKVGESSAPSSTSDTESMESLEESTKKESYIDGNTLIALRGGLQYAPGSDKPYSGVAVWYYENGQKRSEETYKNGKLDGLWTDWYENGQKWQEGTFKDGELDGLWTFWQENGRKKEVVIGTKKGLYTEYYDNGQKKEQGTRKDGKRDGVWIYWYENGQKESERIYKDGKFEGLVTRWYYYENGQKESERIYKDGKKIEMTFWTYYENGQKKNNGKYKNGIMNGKWTNWYANGQKRYERTFKDKRKDGLSTIWYADGRKMYKGTFKNGDLISEKWY